MSETPDNKMIQIVEKSLGNDDINALELEANKQESEEMHSARMQNKGVDILEVIQVSCVLYNPRVAAAVAAQMNNIINSPQGGGRRGGRRGGDGYREGEVVYNGPLTQNQAKVMNKYTPDAGILDMDLMALLENVPWTGIKDNAVKTGEIMIKGLGVLSIGGLAVAAVAIAPFVLAIVGIVGAIIHHAMNVFDKRLEDGSASKFMGVLTGNTSELLPPNPQQPLSSVELPEFSKSFNQLSVNPNQKFTISEMMQILLPMFADLPKDQLEDFLKLFQEKVAEGSDFDGLAYLTALYANANAKKMTKVSMNPIKKIIRDDSTQLLEKFGNLLSQSMSKVLNFTQPNIQQGGGVELNRCKEAHLVGNSCMLFANVLRYDKAFLSMFNKTSCNQLMRTELTPCMKVVMINIGMFNTLIDKNLLDGQHISREKQQTLADFDILKMRYLKLISKYNDTDQCYMMCVSKFTPFVTRCKIVRFQDRFEKLNGEFERFFKADIERALRDQQGKVMSGGRLPRGVKYSILSLNELKALVKARSIPGRSKLRTKDDFISALRNSPPAKKKKLT